MLGRRDYYRAGGWIIFKKFFDRKRQNYTMSMEFEMLRSFSTNYELALYNEHYNTI